MKTKKKHLLSIFKMAAKMAANFLKITIIVKNSSIVTKVDGDTENGQLEWYLKKKFMQIKQNGG